MMAVNITTKHRRYCRVNGFRLVLSGFIILSGSLLSCKKAEIPTLTTTEITNITNTSALTGGNITNDGGDVTARGVCWNNTGNPTIANKRTIDGTGEGAFTSSLTQLIPGTYYIVRAYATNSAGTGYGNELSFVTPEITISSVDDIDGNTYATVTIGTQTWMAENLKTTRYNDNTPIPLVTGNTEWSHLITPGYCWYNNDSSTYKADYGALYNWYAVITLKLCPTGWHVPTDAQWLIMSDYLGGESAAGDKLKEEGGAHWILPEAGGTNESGFTALPGGGRVDGEFGFLGMAGAWWSSTGYDDENAWCRELDYDKADLLSGSLKKNNGFSVRCIKE